MEVEEKVKEKGGEDEEEVNEEEEVKKENGKEEDRDRRGKGKEFQTFSDCTILHTTSKQ